MSKLFNAKMARFLAVGGLNTLVGYGFYTALTLLGLPLAWAIVLSMVMSVLFNFYSYGEGVFGGVTLASLPRFVVFYGCLCFLNWLSITLLARVGLGPLLAQALLLPLLALSGFAGMRFFVFR